MQGWKTITFNALTAVATIFGGQEILQYVDAQTAILVVTAANMALRCLTSTAVGAARETSNPAFKMVALWMLAISVTACSSLPQFSAVAPTVCSLATSAEAQKAARALLEKLPPGTDKDRAIEAERMAEISADATCVFIKALESKQGAQSLPGPAQ